MKYKIKGETLPVVICDLDKGETMISEGGSMAWMSPNMKMETTSNGNRKGNRQNVFGRKNVSEQVYPQRAEAA